MGEMTDDAIADGERQWFEEAMRTVHPYTCGSCSWQGQTRRDYFEHAVREHHDHWEAILDAVPTRQGNWRNLLRYRRRSVLDGGGMVQSPDGQWVHVGDLARAFGEESPRWSLDDPDPGPSAQRAALLPLNRKVNG